MRVALHFASFGAQFGLAITVMGLARIPAAQAEALRWQDFPIRAARG